MSYLMDMVKTRISSKGQTTIPSVLRKKWKVSQIWWEMNSDGTARVSPTPDIMSLLGSAADGKPRDPEEKKKARRAMGGKPGHAGGSK
jgi:bifunctional DNA-binding transcriptional regulator/antitoxin component of YhaV-PrlF toxin-antitoxin module